MAGTISCDVYARGYNTDTAWIPYPVSKKSPQLAVDLSLDEILELLTHSEIWIYDASTKTNINTNNLNTYFPEFIPPYNRGGAGGGGGGGGNGVVTLTEEEYVNLPSHDPETLYAIYSDDGFRLMLGDLPMTGGGSTSTSFATKFVTSGALGNASTFTIPE